MPGVARSTRSVGIGVNLLPRAIFTSYYVKDFCGVMESRLLDDHQKPSPAEGSSVFTPTAVAASQQRLLSTEGSSVTTSTAVAASQQRLLAAAEGSSVTTTTAEAAPSAEKPNFTKVYPKSEFLKLLQSVGAKGRAFTISEIIRYLKKYISSRMLYDPHKPWLVHCSNDKLGKVFRRNHFTIVDVRDLLYQNVTFTNKSNSFTSNEADSCDSDATEILDSSKSDSDHGSSQTMLPRDDVITSSTSDPVNPGQNTSPLFCVTPAFLEILHVAGAKGHMFTEKEIFRYLKHYIWSRKLFDPERPWIFLCHNDRLADVFKLEKFIIYDVPSLIAKYGVESPEYRPKLTKRLNSEELKEMLDTNSRLNSHSSAPGRMQSTPSDITSSTTDSTTTRTTSLLEESLRASTSSSPSTSFTLTLEMNNENEVLSIESEEPVEDVYVEYEVMSSTSSVQVSDSEEEQPHVSMDMLVICQDSDMEFWADLSENGSDSDVELSEADKWCCSQCHAYNSPIHRLCDICWTIRPGWLPNYDSQKNSNEDTESTDDLTNCGKAGVTTVKAEKSSTSDDCPIDKVSHIRNTLSNICYYSETDIPARRTRNQTGSRKRCLTSESEESDISGKIRRLSSPEKLSTTPGLCLICSQNPRDASLIHGTSGHQICCLTCAKKLKRKGHKCPICRRTIQKVVRNYLT